MNSKEIKKIRSNGEIKKVLNRGEILWQGLKTWKKYSVKRIADKIIGEKYTGPDITCPYYGAIFNEEEPVYVGNGEFKIVNQSTVQSKYIPVFYMEDWNGGFEPIRKNTTLPIMYDIYRFDIDASELDDDMTKELRFSNKGTKYELIYQTHVEKGDYIEDIEAEENTYPQNGIQDGFWYVLKEGE